MKYYAMSNATEALHIFRNQQDRDEYCREYDTAPIPASHDVVQEETRNVKANVRNPTISDYITYGYNVVAHR